MQPGQGHFNVETSRRGTVRVDYSSVTAIRGVDGRNSIDQIRTGDRVRVEGRWEGDRTIHARQVVLTSSSGSGSGSDAWRSGDVGRITTIGEERRYLRVEFAGRQRRVNVENANVRAGGQTVRVRDLRPGGRVAVYGRIDDNEIRATRVEVLD
jgi:hypothetical protein